MDYSGLKPTLIERLTEVLRKEKEEVRKRLDTSATNTDPCKLFVGQIPSTVAEGKLREVFSPFGEIKEIVLLKDKFTGAPRGCGFVSFASKDAAQSAIENLNNKVTLPGAKRELIVSIAGPKSEQQQETKLYVGMLSQSTTEEEIRQLFEQFGQINEVFLMTKDGVSRGCAFVKFSNREDAQRAINNLHDKVKDKDAGGNLQVRFAQTKEQKGQLLQKNAAYMAPPLFGTNALNPFLAQQLRGATFGAGGFGFTGALGPQASLMGLGLGLGPAIGTGVGRREEVTRGPPGSNIFVYGIPDHYSDNDLGALFTGFGSLLSSKVQYDLQTGRSKGFGFVSFDNARSASAAVAAMDGFVLGNKRLNVRIKKGEGEQRQSFNPY